MFKNQVMNKMLCQSGYLNTVGEVSLPNSRVQSLSVIYIIPSPQNI